MNTRYKPGSSEQSSRATANTIRSNEAIASLLTSLGTLVLGALLAINLASSLQAPTIF